MIFPKRESNPAVLEKLVERIKMTEQHSAGSSKDGVLPPQSVDLIRSTLEDMRKHGLTGGLPQEHAFTLLAEIDRLNRMIAWLDPPDSPTDETNCNHPASTGVRAWKCDICGTLRESPELGPIALAQRDAEISRLLAIVRESHGNSDGYGPCECPDCAPRAAAKANACQCDPNPSIGGSPPCPVHDGESEGEQS